uniref:Uncharacterized protein n=1 Tax=Clastoptera arizonana TaxID=38151 RepID=A0A1B6E1S1_9HEMI
MIFIAVILIVILVTNNQIFTQCSDDLSDMEIPAVEDWSEKLNETDENFEAPEFTDEEMSYSSNSIEVKYMKRINILVNKSEETINKAFLIAKTPKVSKQKRYDAYHKMIFNEKKVIAETKKMLDATYFDIRDEKYQAIVKVLEDIDSMKRLKNEIIDVKLDFALKTMNRLIALRRTLQLYNIIKVDESVNPFM